MYTVFKIAKSSNKFSDDFTFGVNDENISKQTRDKINSGILEFGMPWDECIPYYSDAFHVFYDYGTLQYFITNVCKLNEVEINELKQAGYSLYKITTGVISNGLSHSRATIFEDEIKDITEIDLKDLINKDSICAFKAKSSRKDVVNVKNKYYKNVETIQKNVLFK